MFVKSPLNPVLARKKDTFYSVFVANPDILEYGDKLLYYFRGQDENGHDRIGLAVSKKEKFDGVTWEKIYPEPVVSVSSDPSAPDSKHVLDPASVVWNGKVYLYYTAYCEENGEGSICLATSSDGVHFEKSPFNPIVRQAYAPEVVVKDGKLHLFYQRWTQDEVRKSVFCVCTGEGEHFDFTNEQRLFSAPSGCVSVSTNRILHEGEWYYDFCGKCKRFKDYPETIGIARSRDLLHWEFSTRDVLTRGEAGSWDEGALWFATVYRKDDVYYMWYEGFGTGNGCKSEADKADSDKAVNGNYGGFAVTSFSQIGMATYCGRLEDFFDK